MGVDITFDSVHLKVTTVEVFCCINLEQLHDCFCPESLDLIARLHTVCFHE